MLINQFKVIIEILKLLLWKTVSHLDELKIRSLYTNNLYLLDYLTDAFYDKTVSLKICVDNLGQLFFSLCQPISSRLSPEFLQKNWSAGLGRDDLIMRPLIWADPIHACNNPTIFSFFGHFSILIFKRYRSWR